MQAPAVVKRNPNAATAVVGTGPGALVVWFLGNVLHVEISAEVGVMIGGAVIAAWLGFSHLGLLGVWRRILHGDGS